MSTACTRYPRHNLKIAWTRVKNDTVVFATVDSSLVDGLDIVQGQLDIITEPDKFKYFDESERVIGLSFDRRVQEPLGGIAYTIGDIVLDNTTKRFTWGISDTVGTALKRGRPLKMFMGFKIQDVERMIPVMYGLTDKLKENKENRTFTISTFDYISYINDYELETAIFVDQRSDQIIASILSTVGFISSQYSLDTGLNTIGFAWFKKGTKAGDAIRKICEAEEGYFYQDEQGLIRFQNRRNYLEKNTVTWTINPEDVISYERSDDVKVINRCIVKSKPRTVQSTVEIWKSTTVIEVQYAETNITWASFKNPVTAITNPVATTDYLVNSASDGSGNDETGNVTIGIDKFAEDAKLTITNDTGHTVYVTLFRLRGTPAIIDSEIEELYEDTDSEENYGRQQLIIENNFIDSSDFAYYIARALVRKYKEPLKRLKVTILANPALQLKDKVSVKDLDLGTYSSYRIMGIQGNYNLGGMTQTLLLREITGLETDTPAIVDTSLVDGGDVVWT